MNADGYLLGIIACMAEHKKESPTYPGAFHAFDTGDLVEYATEKQWDEELTKVRDACWILLKRQFEPFHPSYLERLDAIQMKLFTWLGHNLQAMWD